MQGRVAAYTFVFLIAVTGIISFRLPSLQFFNGLLAQAMVPAQQAVADPSKQATNFIQTVSEVGRLREENARLRDEIDRLRGQTSDSEELKRENQSLREQLNLKREQPSFQWLPARVIGRDASNLLRSVAIDKGSSDGLALGMTVVSPAGLVGQLTKVGPNTARVLLITDVSSSVTAVIQSSRADGVVNGQGQQYLMMRYIPQPVEIKTGDRVITSGVGGIFPHGLPIGKVTSVSKKDVELSQEARLQTDVDFQHLETVLVITNYVPLRIE